MGEISFGQYSCKSNASHALEGQGFNVISLLYVPGKDILVAGALSRSPVTTGEDSFHEEIQAHVNELQSKWQVTDAGHAKIRVETLKAVNLKAAKECTIHVGLIIKRMFSWLPESSSSWYIDFTYLPSLTPATVIGKRKMFFAHHRDRDSCVRQRYSHLFSRVLCLC